METTRAANKLSEMAKGTISEQSHKLGMANYEPVIVAMDAMIRYAKAHRLNFHREVSDDYCLGPIWLAIVANIRHLCDWDGAVAMERGITTDSKDNGTVEEMFWQAMELAGFEESDLV